MAVNHSLAARRVRSFLTPNDWPWLALFISAGLLCGAWFFQYVLGYPPCQMCYWQRHAHKVVIVLSLLAIIAPRFGFSRYRVLNALIGAALLGSFGLAFWHSGVEYGWWEGPKTCMAVAPNVKDFNPEELLKSLEGPQKMPSCTEAMWHLLGLSMAGWNAVVSGIAALISFRVAMAPRRLEAAND